MADMPFSDNAEPGWADLYTERAVEQVSDIGTDGMTRISARQISGIAARAIGPARTCFIQSGLPGQEQDLSQIASLAPPVTVDRLRLELSALSELAAAPENGHEDWLADARDMLEAARTAALDSGARQAQARLWRQHRCYATSCGGSRAAQSSSILRLTVAVRNGTARGMASAADIPAAPLTIARAVAAGRHAAAHAAAAAAAVSPASGTTAVIFAPEPAGVLIHEVVHALEADIAHESPLWATRGSWSANPALTVVDDPFDPWAWEQVAVDEEGTPCSRADLILAGQVVGVLADRASASRLGIDGTGHGRRGSYASPPVPRMRHTVASAGPDLAASIVADTERGILIRAVETADAIPGQGRFSLRVLNGCEIVNGTAGQPLTGFTITGGLAEFRSLDAVGDDQRASTSVCGRQGRWLPVSHSAPTLRFPRLSVRGGRAAS
jgi:predicted Zn-dependent protease